MCGQKDMEDPVCPFVRLSICPSRPFTKKVTETENITKQSCQINFKD